jgi:hypothetical protein
VIARNLDVSKHYGSAETAGERMINLVAWHDILIATSAAAATWPGVRR